MLTAKEAAEIPEAPFSSYLTFQDLDSGPGQVDSPNPEQEEGGRKVQTSDQTARALVWESVHGG